MAHISPEDPDATFSPIFNNLISISLSPTLGCTANIFSAAEVWVEPNQDPYKYSQKPVQYISLFPSSIDSATYQTIYK